jgi:hypothetical protein
MKKLIIGLLLLSSCSANWHIKRAIKKDPTILLSDTITINDTIRVSTERVYKDSIFMVSNDTTIIVKDNLTIKHFISNDTVFLSGECDSIIKYIPYEVKVPYKYIIQSKKTNYLNWSVGLIALIIVVVLLRLFYRPK